MSREHTAWSVPFHTHPWDLITASKCPSCDSAVDTAQNMAPSKGDPCLLISTAVAAAAQRLALSSSFCNILQTRKKLLTAMHI